MNLNYTDKKRNLSLLPKVEQIDGAGGGGGASPPPHGGFVVAALWHKINEVQGRRGGSSFFLQFLISVTCCSGCTKEDFGKNKKSRQKSNLFSLQKIDRFVKKLAR